MEDYLNLISPLQNGVFVADNKNLISNYDVLSLPSLSDYFRDLRNNYQEQITSSSNLQSSDTTTSSDNSTSNSSNKGIAVDLSKYQGDMRLSFPELLKLEGIKIRVTSQLRKGARTASGHPSHHGYINQWGFSGACDIVPTDGNFNNLRQQIYSNPRIVAWLVNHKIGVLEEITHDVKKVTGATGNHFHIGPDRWAISMSSKYIDYSTGTMLWGKSSSNNSSNNSSANIPSFGGTSTYTGKKYTLRDVGWNVTRGFKGISTYRIDLNSKVSLTKEDLWKLDTGQSQTVHRPNLIGTSTKLGKGTIAARHNNPCNISPTKGDLGYNGSSSAADGQTHAGYQNVVYGLAATMRLFTRSYNNKSIRSMNNGLLGYLTTARKKYSEQDWKALENARLRWITNVSDYLGISPFMKLNLNDKETMFTVLAAIAKKESGSILGRSDLEAAWKIFKNNY